MQKCISGCPEGYHSMAGSIQGEGIKRYQTSILTCKHDCDEDEKCGGFTFKEDGGSECMLFEENKPDGPIIENTKFCRKLGMS